MALRDNPYLPLYIQDFLTDEKLIECSAESTGVYIRLMCLMHKSDDYGKILLKQKDKQNDKQIINFALKISKQMPFTHEIIERSLEELLNENVLQIEGDYLIQKRMVRDCILSEKRALSGSEGGKKNKYFAQAKNKANTQANTQANTDIDIDNDISISNISIKDNNIIKDKIKNTYSGDDSESSIFKLHFSHFWSAYPKKENQENTFETFLNILISKQATPHQLITGAQNYNAYCMVTYPDDYPNCQYIKLPGNWLKEKMWTTDWRDKVKSAHSKKPKMGTNVFGGR